MKRQVKIAFERPRHRKILVGTIAVRLRPLVEPEGRTVRRRKHHSDLRHGAERAHGRPCTVFKRRTGLELRGGDHLLRNGTAPLQNKLRVSRWLGELGIELVFARRQVQRARKSRIRRRHGIDRPNPVDRHCRRRAGQRLGLERIAPRVWDDEFAIPASPHIVDICGARSPACDQRSARPVEINGRVDVGNRDRLFARTPGRVRVGPRVDGRQARTVRQEIRRESKCLGNRLFHTACGDRDDAIRDEGTVKRD